jgi:hypothetical protein
MPVRLGPSDSVANALRFRYRAICFVASFLWFIDCLKQSLERQGAGVLIPAFWKGDNGGFQTGAEDMGISDHDQIVFWKDSSARSS